MKARILAVVLAFALPVAAQGNPAASPSSGVSPTGSAAASSPKANARAAKAQNTQSPCDARKASRARANSSKKTPAT